MLLFGSVVGAYLFDSPSSQHHNRADSASSGLLLHDHHHNYRYHGDGVAMLYLSRDTT